MQFFDALKKSTWRTQKMHATHKNMKTNNLLASRKQHWKGQTIKERE